MSENEKISAMLLECVSSFINNSQSIEVKQDYINAATTAWNIACLPKHDRKSAVNNYITAYRKTNSSAEYHVVKEVRSDIERLVKEKIKMFPNVHIGIIEAKATETDRGLYVHVVSTVL